MSVARVMVDRPPGFPARYARTREATASAAASIVESHPLDSPLQVMAPMITAKLTIAAIAIGVWVAWPA